MEQMNLEQPDPEMLKNLELLINMDVLEEEAHWEEIKLLDQLESSEEDHES